MPKLRYTQAEPSVHELDSDDEIISQPELQPETEVSAKKLPQKNASVSKHRKNHGRRKKKKEEKSAFSRFFSALSSKISKGIRRSAISRALTSHEKTAEAFRNTWLYGLFFSEKNINRIDRAKVKFRRTLTDATTPKLFGRASSSLLTVKSRVYGLILFMFGIAALAVHYLVNAKFNLFIYDAYAPFTAAGICVVALLFLFSNNSFYRDIYESKLLGSIIFSLMGVSHSSKTEESSPDLSSAGACAVGILLGLLTIIFPASSILLFILLMIYAAVVIKSPESGMISVILIAPFAPLNAIAISIALLAISYIFKLMCGKRTLKLEFSDIPVALFMLTVLSAQTVSFGGIASPVISLLFMLSYFIAVSILRSEVWFEKAIHAIALCVSVMSVAALLFYSIDKFINVRLFTDFPIISYRENISQTLLYSVFILFALIIKAKSRKAGFGLSLILICTLVYLYFTLPAAAVLAALVAIVIFLALYNIKNIFIISIFGAVWIVLARFIPKLNIIANINAEKNSFSGSNPIIGFLSEFGFVGIGSAKSATDILHSPILSGTEAALLENNSLFLSLGLELGYLGLIMFVISFFFILQNAFSYGQSCIDRTNKQRVVCYAAMSGLICAFIYGFWGNIFAEPRMVLIYWLLAGITVSGSRCSKGLPGQSGQDIPSDCY